MAQKMPRNQALHERRHKRKAGAHEDRRGTRRAAADELRAAIEDYLRQTGCPCEYGDGNCGAYQAKRRVQSALEAIDKEG